MIAFEILIVCIGVLLASAINQRARARQQRRREFETALANAFERSENECPTAIAPFRR